MALGSTQPLTETSTRNISWVGGKGSRCVRLTTLPPSCADCLQILGVSTSSRPKDLPRPVMGGGWINRHYKNTCRMSLCLKSKHVEHDIIRHCESLLFTAPPPPPTLSCRPQQEFTQSYRLKVGQDGSVGIATR